MILIKRLNTSHRPISIGGKSSMKFLTILFLLFSYGCKVNIGTNESSRFKVMSLDLKTLNYETLKNEILIPQCMSCHTWVKNDGEIAKRISFGKPDQSVLFNDVESGRMPPKGSKLMANQIEYIKFFILNYKGSVTPIREPKLEATYTSMRYHLIEKSCIMCHNPNGRKPYLDTYERVRDKADDVIDYIEHGDVLGSPMPPIGKDGKPKAPVPSAEILSLFKKWVETGSLDN